ASEPKVQNLGKTNQERRLCWDCITQQRREGKDNVVEELCGTAGTRHKGRKGKRFERFERKAWLCNSIGRLSCFWTGPTTVGDATAGEGEEGGGVWRGKWGPLVAESGEGGGGKEEEGGWMKLFFVVVILS
ncbi:hypothetical protein Tco_0446816, partial [Tanacetum coccineum]